MASTSLQPLRLHFLGDFRIVSGEEVVSGIDTPRLQSLLAYLVMHSGIPQPRSHLAFTFWLDSTESQARTNLRKQLHYLRRALPDADRFVYADAQVLEWRSDAPFTLDVTEFESAITDAEKVEQDDDQALLQSSLERAVDLYRGDLLPGSYEDWALAERERLRQRVAWALDKLILVLEGQRAYQLAIRYAQRLLQHDPWHEGTYRHLMRLHALNGDRARALRAYHTCATVLQRELGVEPSPETREAYERLLALDVRPVPAPEAPHSALPLIGRKGEWAQLQAAWRSAFTGQPHLVLIDGEEGIGKTRLAEELLRWANQQGIPTASARCYASEEGLAYAPVAAWLRIGPLRAALSTLDEVWLGEVARLLPELLVERPEIAAPGPLTETWQLQRFFDALARPFFAVRQLLLFLDDMQWCDRETLVWLATLLRVNPSAGSGEKRPAALLLVGTIQGEDRPEEGLLSSLLADLRHSGRLTEMKLGPLNSDQSALLAAHVAGHKVDLVQARELYRETEGNPLFLIESLRAGQWDHEQALGVENPVVESSLQPLPAAMRAAISARLGRLSPEARELVNVAAVIGREFTFDVLASVAQAPGQDFEEGTLICALDELWQRHIVREQGEDAYDFQHDKIRQVAYYELSGLRRRHLHRQVAQALEALYGAVPVPGPDQSGNTVMGRIAVHFEKGSLPDRALPYYICAAHQAARIYANHQAEGLYRRAMTLATQLDRPALELVHLYQSCGSVLELDGRYAEAIQVYCDLQSLARERGDQAMEAVAVAHLVTAYVQPTDQHNPELTGPLIERGLALAREIGDHHQESRLLWSKMVSASQYGAAGEAQAAGEASMALAREHGLHDRLGYVLNDLALNLRLSGKLERGQACAEEARALFREQGNLLMLADNLNQQAAIDLFHLDFKSALQRIAESNEVSWKINNGWNLSLAALLRGLVHGALGDWGAALANLEVCLQFGEGSGSVVTLTSAPAELGRLLRCVGQIEDAWALHKKAHEASLRRAPYLLRAIESQLAMDAFAAGRVEEGSRWLRSVWDREPCGEIGTAWHVLADPATAAVREAEWTGAWDLATGRVEQALAEANRRRLTFYEPLLRYEHGRCLEALKRFEEADGSYQEALTAAKANGLLPVQWQVHAGLARLYAAQGPASRADAERAAAVRIVLKIADSLIEPGQRESLLSTPAVRVVVAAAQRRQS